ncbi:hypothetical protein [Roseixanthobacter pseudopolyaromaticivorans]|uniref:hypothetical protein n=1 Tax=Xanthobacteraceae TaxID=335928 RepID=UPI00372BF054
MSSEKNDGAARIAEGLADAAAIASGEKPAPVIHINGHAYVPKKSLDELVAERDRLAAALERVFKFPGCIVVLDGRNRHGSHVIMSLPSNLPAEAEGDVIECAEEVLQAAEALGFQIGDAVWTEWHWNPPQMGDYGRAELPGYWEFIRVDEELTCAALSLSRKQGG